jgi:antitoxin (DNA-binding transcriptional repressor) of toxin-antitoxin stability system
MTASSKSIEENFQLHERFIRRIFIKIMKLNFKFNLGVAMKTVSVLEFRKQASKIIQSAINGRRMVMTYRGKPVFRIEPIEAKPMSDDEPFYRLAELANKKASSLTNDQIDKIIYDR